MRKIVSDDAVAATAVHGSGGRSRPIVQDGVYIPQYRSVNQSLNNTNTGQVAFMDALARDSSRRMAAQQTLYDNMEISSILSATDASYHQASQQFLGANPSGQAYTDFITNTYSELTKSAIDSASNTNVKQTLTQVFKSRQVDVANNAFKIEKERYTGYAINAIESELNTTINELMLSPGEVNSLAGKYQQQLSGMQAILNRSQFEKFEKSKKEDFLYAYGLSLIKHTPYDAIDLLRGEQFVKGLDPKRFNALQFQARKEVKYQEEKAKQYQAMVAAAKRNEELATYHKMDIAIVQGNLSEGDIEAADLSEEYKYRLKKSLLRESIKFAKHQQSIFDIQKALKENILPPEGISSDNQKRYLNEYFKAENDKREETHTSPLSLCEKVKFCEDHSLIFNTVYSPLQHEIVDTIRNSNKASDILDGCLASAGTTVVPAIGKIDKDIADFSNLVSSIFEASSDVSKLVKLRDDYFAVSSESLEQNKKRWERDFSSSQLGEKLKDFYSECGFGGHWWAWGEYGADINSSADVQKINDHVINIMKRVYFRTGSETKAFATAAGYLRDIVKYDSRIGEYVINPPTPKNTGLTQDQLDLAIDKDKAAALSIAQKAKTITTSITVENLRLESVDFKSPRYSLYYLIRKDDPMSREYLYDANGRRIIMNLRGSHGN